MRKKILKFVVLTVFIFLIGGMGGVYFDQNILPSIRANKQLSRLSFFKKTSENVTIINKTEQISVTGDDLINEISSQAGNAVVNIVSIGNPVSSKILVNKNAKENGLSGTGVVVTSDGMIATYRNAIIEKDASYKVFLYDGSYYDAKLVGIDEFTNLAYLKTDATNLTSISIANSDDYHPGRKLIAIGNAFGEYQNRYSAGFLSNLNKSFNLAGKSLSSTEKFEGVFETDFNSTGEYLGGPLIGYDGQLVGIVGSVLIDNKVEYFEIPSNVLKKSLDLAIRNSLDSRPYFGAYYVPITKEYAILNNLKSDRGALIFTPSAKQGLAVISNSPAEKAGLKINDIVTMVNSQGVNLDNPLSNLLNQYKKGDKVELTLLREGNEIKIEVQL
jgi:S1-C subfamily serine protease